jgi:hypothetical protein
MPKGGDVEAEEDDELIFFEANDEIEEGGDEEKGDMLEAYAKMAVENSGDSAEAGAGFMEEVERANGE